MQADDEKATYDLAAMCNVLRFPFKKFNTLKNMIAATLNTPEKAGQFFTERLDFILDPAAVNEQIENDDDIMVIDTRATEDFIKGHVPGAINLPKGQWDDTSGWPNDWSLIIYGYSPTCHLAAHAAIAFANQGFSVMEMEGGFATWKENKLPVEI
jgi:rhodanese-related sulfurtransferase